MPISTAAFPSRLRSVFILVLAAALALGLAAPRPALANSHKGAGLAILGVAVGGLMYCANNPGKCGGTSGGSGRGGGGPVDAIALDQTQAMWVQGGLQNTGFYDGAIDGAIGAGTRASIRAYQAGIGEEATGAMTARQINDLVALSPAFVASLGNPPAMLTADIAPDLSRDEVAQLQAALNSLGYNAGPVDGAAGGKTRDAIAAYKAREGLPGGPLPSRRLLAYMMGWPAPEPAGLMYAAMRPSLAAPPAAPASASANGARVAVSTVPGAQVAQPSAAPVQAGSDLGFDLNGLGLGMSEDGARATLAATLGALESEVAGGADFGAPAQVSHGLLAVQPGWPAPGSEQVLVLFDAARPELGAVAAFRLIHMPAGFDQTAFEAQVLPDILAKYGADGQVGNGRLWIGGAAARSAVRSDATRLMECGDFRVSEVSSAPGAAALWGRGGGVRLDPASLATVSADCGEVLNVVYSGEILRIGLWNSAAFAPAAVAPPKIKF